MVLPTPDMDDCCKKERCLFGPNIGLAYSICEPCPPDNTFSEEECDCIPDFPIGAVQYRIVDGNMTVDAVATECVNNPSEWRNAHPAPYIDNLGRLIQYTLKPVADWGCSGVVLNYGQDCNEWPTYHTDFTVVKVGGCGGGGNILIRGVQARYVDGEFDVNSSNYAFSLRTSCETPPGWTDDPFKATHCASQYTVPFVWTATIEWRQTDGEGGYIPL